MCIKHIFPLVWDVVELQLDKWSAPIGGLLRH